MSAIYAADQGDRAAEDHIDWSVVGPRDRARQARTRELLAAGRLHSGKDFLHAAFIFQHGAAPDDYLLAHTLAVVATAKGAKGGGWIAAATLDRYLMNLKQPQIYGTQYQGAAGKPYTQDPYDRALISDALRHELQVPDQAAQEKQRLAFGLGPPQSAAKP